MLFEESENLPANGWVAAHVGIFGEPAFRVGPDLDPSDGYRIIAAPSMGRTLQTMAGDEHRVNRASVSALFMPLKVRSYVEAMIEPIAHELMDRIVGQREVEFVQAFTRPYPFTVITRLLGIPVSDEAMLLQWAVKLIDFPWDPEGALKAKTGFDAYMQGIIDARRARPMDDFVSLLVKTEFEGQTLDDERILSFFRLLFPAGSDTTYKNAGSLFACVLADPEFRAQAMRGNKDREALVAEGLRWQTPTAMLPRMATGNIKLGDAHIKKGDWVLFGITAANNDPKVFSNPRKFDPSRDNRGADQLRPGRAFLPGHASGPARAGNRAEDRVRALSRYPAQARIEGRVRRRRAARPARVVGSALRESVMRVIFIDDQGIEHSVIAEAGDSAMRCAADHLLPGIVGACGGAMACATCHGYVADGWLAMLPASVGPGTRDAVRLH